MRAKHGALQATGFDPMKAAQAQAPADGPRGRGGAGRGALRGAAGAALIADIADGDTDEALATFNKGFAACLEGKHYTVK